MLLVITAIDGGKAQAESGGMLRDAFRWLAGCLIDSTVGEVGRGGVLQ